MTMPKYIPVNFPERLTPAQIITVLSDPCERLHRAASIDENVLERQWSGREPIARVIGDDAGYPRRVANDPVNKTKHDRLPDIDWSKNVILCGPFRAGKTTLTANAYYHRLLYNLDYKGVAVGHPWRRAVPDLLYWDTCEFVSVLTTARKIGLTRACEDSLGEHSGEDLENRVLRTLNATDHIAVFDDFNAASIATPDALKFAQDTVMRRYMNGAVTWLVSNDPLDSLQQNFPRLASRVIGEPDWQAVEVPPFAA